MFPWWKSCTGFPGFLDLVHPFWISLKGASYLHAASLSIFLRLPNLVCSNHINYLQFFKSIKLVYLCVLWTYLECYPLITALLASSHLSFVIQIKHRLLDSPLMCSLVVLSVQRLLLLLCNAPDFLWGTTFPHCQRFPWRRIPGFAVKNHVTQSWEIRALDPPSKDWFRDGHVTQVRSEDFASTFRNSTTVSPSNIYWALTYLFAGNSTVNQSLYPFGYSLRPWIKPYPKTNYHWTLQVKLTFFAVVVF